MIVGAQGYTVREFAKEESGIAQTMKRLKEIGFSALQVSAFGQIAPERLKELADEYEIKIVVTHINPDLIRDHTEEVIRSHKILNCPYVGIGMMPDRYRTGEDGLEAFLSDYDLPARKLREHGLKLQYHNHFYEYQKLGGKVILDRMAEETDPELWGFILDVFWTQFGGRCPARQIEMLKGRIDVCHFKDMKICGEERCTAAVMDGNLSWDEIIAACEKTGIPYAMIEQDECYGKNPFDELKLSHDNLQAAGIRF